MTNNPPPQKTDRDAEIEAAVEFIVRQCNRGDGRATLALREPRLRDYLGHLHDGEADGLEGAELQWYARKKTCGFNIMLWLTIGTLLLRIFDLWLLWKKSRPQASPPPPKR